MAASGYNNRYGKRVLTIAEAIEMLDELSSDDEDTFSDDPNEKEVDMVIIPPKVDVLTDNEDINENELQAFPDIPVDIAGEIKIQRSFESAKITPQHKISKNPKGKKKQIVFPSWSHKLPIYDKSPKNVEKDALINLSSDLNGLSPLEIFSKMFTDELCSHIVEQSNLYACQNNRHNFALSVNMLKRFLLFTGYHCLPQEQMYWSLAEDLNIPLVRNAMCMSTYLSIKQNLHLADNTKLDKCDKLAKICPYIDIMNKNFMQYGIFSHNLSIDEQMIPYYYYGKHSSKMFMKGKPIRFGFKVWCLASYDGYLYQFNVYAGKCTMISNDLGLGGQVVTQILDVVENPSNHVIYFDNFFTSYGLMKNLTEREFFATGTIRENRIGNRSVSPLITSNDLKTKPRGTYDYMFDSRNKVTIVKWNDNSVVCLATNWDQVKPTFSTKRYSRKEHKKIDIVQPKLIIKL